MTIQFLRFRVLLPKLRSCCLISSIERCRPTSQLPNFRIPARSYMKRISDRYESGLKTKDRVPEEFSLIYRGGMDYYIHLAKNGSVLLLFLSIASLGAVMFDDENVVTFPVNFGDRTSIIGYKSWTQFFVMYGVFFVFIGSMWHVSRSYVLRMYYNPTTKTYRAIKTGYMPMATIHHDFPAETLNRIKQKHVIPWKNATYKSNGTNLLMFEHGFKTNADYDRMFVKGSEELPDYEDDSLPKYKN